MNFLENEITEFVECIWDTTLRFPISRSEVVGPCGIDAKEPFYTGIVQITGAWSGTVVLQLDESVATMAAAAMLGLPLVQIEVEEAEDVLGELANMVAGSIKALLPGPSSLTLPIIAKGTEYAISMPGSKVVSEVGFKCDGAPVIVRLLEKIG
ncbi:MAG: chemotaxis protein CheX [Myxococcota bacterium]|jgi:chemotaxis protein CheX